VSVCCRTRPGTWSGVASDKTSIRETIAILAELIRPREEFLFLKIDSGDAEW
jgi:hypothetical protein